MRKGILVSVIIPVFNVRHYLVEAIESVVHQSYENLEILIIDDGSTDGSGEICDQYAKQDQRVRVIHQKNRGLSFARNVGLNLCTGDVVAFLDSDDVYKPEFIEIMLSVMSRDEVDLVVCKYQVYRTTLKITQNDNVKSLPLIETGTYNRINALSALAKGIINPMVWNKIYKRQLWDNIRFPEGHVHEDIDVSYRIIDCCENICIIDESLYLRRIRPYSITTTVTSANASDCILAWNHFEEFVVSNIPQSFSMEHLKSVQRIKLDWMIQYYVKLLQNSSENNPFCCNLRRQIVSLKEDVGLGNVGLLKSLRYILIQHCPWCLRIAYPLYQGIKHVREEICTKRFKQVHGLSKMMRDALT